MHSSPTKTLKPKLVNRVASIMINNSLSHNASKSCLIKNPEIYKIQKRSLSYICVVKDKSSSVTKLYLPTQINKIIKRFTGGKKITDATKIAAETAAEAMQKVPPASSHTVLTKKPTQDSSNTNTTQYSKILDEKQNDDIKAMQDNFDKNKQYQKDAAIPKSIKDNPGVQAKLKTMADKNNSNNTPETNKEQDEFSKANKNTPEITAEQTEQKVNNPLETGINIDVPTNINNSSPKFKSGVLAGIQTSIEQQQLNEKNQKENSAKKQQIKKDKKEELKNIINTDGNNEYS